jgi:hypothetical protein
VGDKGEHVAGAWDVTVKGITRGGSHVDVPHTVKVDARRTSFWLLHGSTIVDFDKDIRGTIFSQEITWTWQCLKFR